MGDGLPELLYMAWRSSLLSSTLTASDDLPSWGNVRDPDVRAAWEAVAVVARREMAGRFVESIRRLHDDRVSDADEALDLLMERWRR